MPRLTILRKRFEQKPRRSNKPLKTSSGSGLGLNELVADKRELSAVRRPGRHIDRALAAEEFGQLLNRTSGQRQQTQPDRMILGMADDAFIVREKNEPLAIRRRMGKPIVEIIGSDLFLLSPIRFHAPNLHRAGALGIVVNESAIGRVVRPIVETSCRSQACFITARGWHGEDIKFTISFGAISQSASVRRPPMPVTWAERRNTPRQTARKRHDVD